MTCRVCQHWKGNVDQWNEDGKPKVVGPCWRDPVPVETASTYACHALCVDPTDARDWLHSAHFYRHEHMKTKAELKKTQATLERVRARVRSLKQKAAKS